MQSKFFWYLLMMSLPVWFELISAPFPNTGFSSQGRQLFSCLDIWSPTNIPPRHCPIRVAQVLSMSTSQDHFSGIDHREMVFRPIPQKHGMVEFQRIPKIIEDFAFVKLNKNPVKSWQSGGRGAECNAKCFQFLQLPENSSADIEAQNHLRCSISS